MSTMAARCGWRSRASASPAGRRPARRPRHAQDANASCSPPASAPTAAREPKPCAAEACRPRKPAATPVEQARRRPRRRRRRPTSGRAGARPRLRRVPARPLLTAFQIATQRVEGEERRQGDDAARRALRQRLGVEHDDKKAAEWYRLAADRGDREAMFALAMCSMAGRAGAGDREKAPSCSPPRPSSGTPPPPTISPCSISKASCSRRISRAPPNCSAAPRRAGSPGSAIRARDPLQGGPRRDEGFAEAARLLAAAARADNTDAQVEYAIALFNGTGVAKNEAAGGDAAAKAARKGSPIAQNRLAHILAVGRGMPADPVEAIKWHLIAKAGGASDIPLDDLHAEADARRPCRRREGGAALARRAQGRASRALDVAALRRQTARLSSRANARASMETCVRPAPPYAASTMLRSALLNVMIKAARKAARTLKRDFGEVEHLQVSLKGPANFVTAADRRAEEILREELEQARPGYGFLGEEGGSAGGQPTRPTPGSSIRSTAPRTSCTASRISRSRSRSSAKARSSPGWSTIPRTTSCSPPSAARAPSSTTSGCGWRRAAGSPMRWSPAACRISAAAIWSSRATSTSRCRARSPACAGSARPRSISPGSRPGAFDAYWERDLSPWDMAGGIVLVREAGGFVTDLDGREDMIKTGDILAGNEDIHRELLRMLKDADKTASTASPTPAETERFAARLRRYPCRSHEIADQHARSDGMPAHHMSGLTDARRLVRLGRCRRRAPLNGWRRSFALAAAVVLPSAASVPYCQAN